MLKESALRLEVHRGGKVDVLEVHADRALVGSGAHCDVRLMPDEAAVEQLLVETRDDDVFVRLLSFDVPCLVNGAPFLEGRISPDALIELGAVALRVRPCELAQAPAPRRARSSSTHPALQALALAGLGVGFFVVLSGRPHVESALEDTHEPPAVALEEEGACPQTDPESARSLAEQAQEDADNKRERSPFYPRDGLLAVPLYLRAAACFAQVGEHGAAEESRAAATRLRERLSDELRVRHVRIERFIAQERYDALRKEVAHALALVDDRASPYASWLSALARETEVRTNSGKERR